MSVRSTQTDEAHRRLLRALLSIVTIISIGTAGYMLVEGWDFSSALFFTVITITTVGYGDYGLSEMGERFTVVLLLGGFGVVTYSFAQIVHAAILTRTSAQERVIRRVQRMEDHIIVCGLGRIGRQICEQLGDASQKLVAIDRDNASVERMIANGGDALLGDATRDEVLLLAGIEDARCIVCVTPSDTENIVIALSARHLNPEVQIIARVDHDTNVLKCKRAGSDIVVSPAASGAEHIVQSLLHPGLAQILNRRHAENGFSLIELKIGDGSRLDGVSILDYGAKHPGLVFVAHAHGDANPQQRPSAQQVLRAGDTLIIAGGYDDLAECNRDGLARRTAA